MTESIFDLLYLIYLPFEFSILAWNF